MKPRLLTYLWFADASRHYIFVQGIEEGEQDSGRQQLYFIPLHRRQYIMIVSQKVTNPWFGL